MTIALMFDAILEAANNDRAPLSLKLATNEWYQGCREIYCKDGEIHECYEGPIREAYLEIVRKGRNIEG